MKHRFIAIFPAIFLSIIGYVTWRGCQVLPDEAFLRPLYAGGNILFFLFFLGTLLFGHKMPIRLASIISFTGNTYLIVMIYLLFSFLLADIVRLANDIAHFAPAGLHNFQYWWMMISLIAIAIVMIIGNYRFNHPKTVKLDLHTDKPQQGKALKIVAVSDIHLGFSINKKNLQRYVSMINAEKPDLVLMAGDVSDRSIKPIIRQNMQEELQQIHAPLGVFAINGNHEHYAETKGATAEYLSHAGIHILIDSTHLIDHSFYLIGRDDRSNEQRKSLASLVMNLNPDLPKILLDHQPHHLEEAQNNGIDLQISGHTHEGQFFPGNLFVKNMFEIQYGYGKKGNTHYYVSSGLGLWGPQYRIGTQSEMVVIQLHY
jgi:predicted MPP superfamily phosphohydrolase